MRGQAGTPAITWPVIDTGNLGGRVRCQHTAALPNAAAADVASQERRELWPRLRGHVTQPASRPLHKKVVTRKPMTYSKRHWLKESKSGSRFMIQAFADCADSFWSNSYSKYEFSSLALIGEIR